MRVTVPGRRSEDVVAELLANLDAMVTSYHPEVTRTGSSLAELVAGTSFFPGGSGLWRGRQHGGALPVSFPERPILLVGHNFDSQRAFQRSLLRKGEASGQFWTFLLAMLESAGVDPATCFFTNALMGLKPGSATGPMPRVPGYLEQCALYLRRQAEIVDARCVVALGSNAACFVRELPWPQVAVRHPSSWIYTRGPLRAEGLREEGGKIAALLTSLL